MDGLSGSGGIQGRSYPNQQIEQGHHLMDVAAEGTVVFIALQGLEQLDDLGHLHTVQVSPAEGVVGELGEIGLNGGQLHQGFTADVEDIPGVRPGGHGPVEGVLPNEVQGAPAKGVHLVVDKDVAGAGQREEEFEVVMKMEPAHVPGVVVVELQMKLHIGQPANLRL